MQKTHFTQTVDIMVALKEGSLQTYLLNFLFYTTFAEDKVTRLEHRK